VNTKKEEKFTRGEKLIHGGDLHEEENFTGGGKLRKKKEGNLNWFHGSAAAPFGETRAPSSPHFLDRGQPPHTLFFSKRSSSLSVFPHTIPSSEPRKQQQPLFSPPSASTLVPVFPSQPPAAPPISCWSLNLLGRGKNQTDRPPSLTFPLYPATTPSLPSQLQEQHATGQRPSSLSFPP